MNFVHLLILKAITDAIRPHYTVSYNRRSVLIKAKLEVTHSSTLELLTALSMDDRDVEQLMPELCISKRSPGTLIRSMKLVSSKYNN